MAESYGLVWNADLGLRVCLGIAAEAVAAEAAETLADMQGRCPVDTGDLKSTLDCRAIAAGDSVLLVATAGGPAESGRFVDYAPYVEEGTSRAPAQPVIRPAVDAATRRLPARIRAIAAARGVQVR